MTPRTTRQDRTKTQHCRCHATSARRWFGLGASDVFQHLVPLHYGDRAAKTSGFQETGPEGTSSGYLASSTLRGGEAETTTYY